MLIRPHETYRHIKFIDELIRIQLGVELFCQWPWHYQSRSGADMQLGFRAVEQDGFHWP